MFNIDQCSGIGTPEVEGEEDKPFSPIEAGEAIVKGFSGAPVIEHGGQQAFYRPKTDSISLPEPARFTSGEDYYATLFHELAHATAIVRGWIVDSIAPRIRSERRNTARKNS